MEQHPRSLRAPFTSSVLALLIVFIASDEAWAYIDPGTGSFILQIVLASLLAAAFSIKVFFGKIRLFFAGMFGAKPELDDEAETSS